MQKGLTSIAIGTAIALYGAGCTVISQYNDVRATKQRVNEKKIEVAIEQTREVDLRNQMRQLSSELANRKITSRELDRRLAELQRHNDELTATNARQRQLTGQARAQLAQYRTQLAALERVPNQTDQQTLAQIAALKEEIRKRLAILAAVE